MGHQGPLAVESVQTAPGGSHRQERPLEPLVLQGELGLAGESQALQQAGDGGGLDQQGEEDHGEGHGEELPPTAHAEGQAEGQGQADRASQAAPDHHMEVGEGQVAAQEPGDPAHGVDGHRPGHQDRDHGDEGWLQVGLEARQVHVHADEQEDEGVGQEGHVLPEVEEDDAGGGGHARGAQVAVDDACGHHGQHAAHVELLGQEVAAVGQDGGQGDLDEVVVDAGDDLGDEVAQAEADDQPARGDHEEVGHPFPDGEGAPEHQPQDDGEDHDGRAVVEEALPLHEQGEAAGRAQGPEGGHHGHRIRGGDEGAEEQGLGPGQPPGEDQDAGHDARAQDHAGHGLPQDGPQVRAQLPEAEVEGGFKDQGRQEEGQHHLRRHLQAQLGLQGRGQAGQDQGHGVGQADAPGHHRHDRDQDQGLDDLNFGNEKVFHGQGKVIG